MEKNNVAELVRRNEQDFISGNTTLSKYVDFSLSETLNTIDAYLNSKHISGSTDSLGREKPFFNISTAAANIWQRATDIDRRNIKIRATKSTDMFFDFLATQHLQKWMRKENFGQFLNDWGRTLAQYGSAVTKFIQAGGELHAMVIPWNRLIVDPVDFDNDVVIEILELTPAQLRKKKGYDKDMVESLIEAATARETTDKQRKDNKNSFIKVYEVHGEMPLSWLTQNEDDDKTYVQQMHVVSFVASKRGRGEYDDFCIYKGKEAKHPYMIAHLLKEDGRTLARGAVENLFDAQWMVNHTKKQIKDQLDLASKLIFQTADENYIGRNALSELSTGDILTHAPNQPLTQLANNSHDITALQNYGTEWKNLAMEVNGISESMMGQTAPSGTAWGQVEAILQESHSLFELMTENKGLALEAMLREFVIPFIKTKMDTTDEIVAVLEAHDIDKIDKKFLPYEATKRLAKKLIDYIGKTGEIPLVTRDMVDTEERNVKEQLLQQGTQRFFKPSDLEDITWNKLLEDFEWEVEVDVTGEQSNDQADMATLSTIFQTIAGNPQILENPKVALLFNRIVEKTGVLSPVELQDMSNMEVPQTPQMGMEGLVPNATPNGMQG
jgi:hypothetical protein